MTAASESGGTRWNEGGAPAASAMATWLRLAAAPAFAAMALLTVLLDRGTPGPLCAAASGLALSGMAPMYVLMTVFHLAPWLKLVSYRQNAANPDSLPTPRSS